MSYDAKITEDTANSIFIAAKMTTDEIKGITDALTISAYTGEGNACPRHAIVKCLVALDHLTRTLEIMSNNLAMVDPANVSLTSTDFMDVA